MKTKQLYFVYILGFPMSHALHAENKIQCFLYLLCRELEEEESLRSRGAKVCLFK